MASSVEFTKKYIENRWWSGSLKIDGGLGPKDHILAHLNDDPVTLYLDVFVDYGTPDISSVETIRDLKQLLVEVDKVGKPVIEQYVVGFPGTMWDEFIELVKTIDSYPCKEQVYTLNPWPILGQPDPSLPANRAVVTSKDKVITVTLQQGYWVPTFDKPLTIAGWEV